MPVSRATIAGVLAIVAWSTTIAFSRTLGEQLGPLTTGACIYLGAGGLGCLAAARRPGGLRAILRLPRRYLLGCGALFAGYMVLLYLAVGLAKNRPQVLAVGLANYLWPALTLLLALPLQRRKADWRLPLGVALSLAGSWLAAIGSDWSALLGLGGDPGGLLPVGLAALAAGLWALYSNLTHRWAPGKTSGVPLFLLASGLLFVPLRFWAGEAAPRLGEALPALLYMAIVPGFLGYSLWDAALQGGDLVLVGALSNFTPLLSTLVSLLVLQVPLNPALGLAAALVTGGALLARGGVRQEYT
jgi:drug/metabolite transporter (DMT)-like permease